MGKLSSEQLRALPESMFGLPKTKQYPMPDKEHVIKAIQFFKYCKDELKETLAKNINKKAKEYGVHSTIQPNSSFYKYADKRIFNLVNEPIKEFHIGQLSPIVGGAPSPKPLLTKEKSKLDKLRNIWDNYKKSLNEKRNQTFNVAMECVNEGIPFDSVMLENFINISEIDYMITPYYNFKYIDENLHEIGTNLACRKYDNDMTLFTQMLDHMSESNIDNINKIKSDLCNISNGTAKAKAIATIRYSNLLSEKEKNEITQSLLYNNGLSFNVTNSAFLSTEQNSYNFNDSDIAKIERFFRLCEFNEAGITQVFMQSESKWINESFGSNKYMIKPRLCNDGYNFILSNKDNIGYYFRKSNSTSGFNIIKIDSSYYLSDCLEFENPKEPNEGKLLVYFLLKIYDDYDEDYNDKIIVNVLRNNIDKYKVQIRCIVKPLDYSAKLESSDFTNLLEDIHIDNMGNINYDISSNDYSWLEKINKAKSFIDKSIQEKDIVNLKINTCFLFSILAILNSRYNDEDVAFSNVSDTKESMLSALEKGIEIFKNSLDQIYKLDSSFNFIIYYTNSKYNMSSRFTRVNGNNDEAICSNYFNFTGLY